MSPEPDRLEALFLANLGAIERIIGTLAWRHGLTGDRAEDFASWAKLRLIENGYAVLRKFRGESAITTYLTVVIAMLVREYRVQHWGRWRPSAAARRRGELAVRLETLVYRDGLTLDEAAHLLRSPTGAPLTRRELAAMLRELPARGRPRPVEVGAEPLTGAPAPSQADDLVAGAEAVEQRDAADRALRTALGRLSPEEQVILRLHYWEGLSVADVARALGLEQKPLYRRIERALATLRRHLEKCGVTREAAQALLAEWVA